ncbi:AraC family transcriptional regulator [Aestuariivirga sp. YIM B02566]|uniref:AraC family transcriptional regulator n=1 Tax=Taklimakanibacter albus TaxID=2800327 RepID=A0ACC5QYG8_9HYPH|nr:AraC family transcriptional regulator [Aestuariivirga sp. YIM B02566]MBK1865435.1 AraC family transcriptional regulator [Aestuariivirga sp. YIM B02566]
MLQISPRDSVGPENLSPGDETYFWRVSRHGDLDCFTATFRKHIFPPHTHETYVIGVTLDGVHSYMHKGVKVRCEAGTICFINPDEVHDGSPDTYGYSYRMTYPSPDFLTAVLREATGRAVGTPRFRLAGAHDPELAQMFCAAHRALEDNTQPLLADEKLIGFYLAAVERYGGGLPSIIAAGAEPDTIARTKDYLLAHLSEATDFQDLAAHVGLSAWHLIRVFRKATGLTPHAWLVDRRVHHARELLRAGESPSHIALQCGFADQAHLTRSFKARLGVTPGQYRALLN